MASHTQSPFFGRDAKVGHGFRPFRRAGRALVHTQSLKRALGGGIGYGLGRSRLLFQREPPKLVRTGVRFVFVGGCESQFHAASANVDRDVTER